MNQAEVKRRQAEEVTNILALITILIIGWITENKGITYVALAVEIYALFWNCVSGNLSDTLGRLLRNRKNKGQYGSIERMRKNTLLFQAVLGLTGSLLLLSFSGNIAEGIFGIRYSTLILRVLSPIILLRSISAVLLGYFQGEGSELPRAISGILRQFLILGFGLLFSGMTKSYGEKVSGLLMQENFTSMYCGVGIAIAILLAEMLILLFLTVLFRGSRRLERRMGQETRYSMESGFDCIRALYSSRWPVLVTGILHVIPLLLGLLFYVKGAEDENAAALEYGLYGGKYLVLCGIAICLILILALPVLARIFQCLRNGENRFAKKVFQSGVHLCLIHGIFLTAFLTVMGGELAELLCPENAEILRKMFMGGSALILFTVPAVYFERFLQAIGKKYLVLGATGTGVCIFILFALVLTNVGKAGILSLVYAGMAEAAVRCIILGLFAYRQLRTQADWLGILIMPLGAGGVTALVCILLEKVFSPHLNSMVMILLAFAAGFLVYWLLLLLLRNLKEQELEVIPGGRLIEKLQQILHIF